MNSGNPPGVQVESTWDMWGSVKSSMSRGPASFCKTASLHSTSMSSTPFFHRRARISWEALWAVSTEVRPGLTPIQTMTGPRVPFSPSSCRPWVKKWAMSMEDHEISCALMMSQIWGPTTSQTLFSSVPKTPWSDFMGRCGNRPTGLENGLMRASVQYMRSGCSSFLVMPL